MNKKISIKTIAATAVFTAVIAALSQVAIPTPIGVSITLQTFAIALTAFLIGFKSVAATLCYILIGALGVPVFAGFSGGVGVLTGPTGGFIFAFPFFSAGLSLLNYVNRNALKAVVGLLSVIVLYIGGILQFCLVTGNSLKTAVIAFSLYFAKDVLTILLAYFLGLRIGPTLAKFIQPKR